MHSLLAAILAILLPYFSLENIAYDPATDCVEGEITLPDTDLDGSPLKPGDITALKLVRYKVNGIITDKTAWSTADPQLLLPGQTVAFVDLEASAGQVINYELYIYSGTHYRVASAKVVCDIVPGPVTGLSAVSDNGNAPVTLSFILPSVDVRNKPLEIPIARVEILRSTTLYAEFPVIHVFTEGLQPGMPLSFVDHEVLPNQTYYYRVRVVSADGVPSSLVGEQPTVSCLLAEDIPAAISIENISVESFDGYACLSWTTAISGAQGGWVNPDDILYDIFRDNIPVAQRIHEPRFTDPLDDISGERIVGYRIEVYRPTDPVRAFTEIDNVAVGQYHNIPAVESFDNPSPDWLWLFDNCFATNGTLRFPGSGVATQRLRTRFGQSHRTLITIRAFSDDENALVQPVLIDEQASETPLAPTKLTPGQWADLHFLTDFERPAALSLIITASAPVLIDRIEIAEYSDPVVRPSVTDLSAEILLDESSYSAILSWSPLEDAVSYLVNPFSLTVSEPCATIPDLAFDESYSICIEARFPDGSTSCSDILTLYVPRPEDSLEALSIESTEPRYYDLLGRPTSPPHPGLYILLIPGQNPKIILNR